MGLRSGTRLTADRYLNDTNLQTNDGFQDNRDNLKLGFVESTDTYDKDLNNYNFAKIEETLSNLASQDFLKKQLIDICYPVGSIFISTSNSNQPPTVTRVTWARIENKFLYATADNNVTFGPSVNENTGGGSTTTTITADNLPKHMHRYNLQLDGETYNENVKIPALYHAGGGFYFSTVDKMPTTSTGGGARDVFVGYSSGASYFNFKFGQSWGTANNVTSNTPIDIMPPYKNVYMWVRTA